ncbi:MAG TPA: cytochrome c3 family protein [Anaeromyxobacteraceae bacterium]|nr:cytochrome c3 family protein [Anaeromyxobacteraceae bacterium]
MVTRAAFLLIASLGAASPAAAAAPAAFKLKPGAEGSLCLDCHPNFAAVLKQPVVHTPVRSKDCTGCHNPHASSHGKFLAAEGGAVCLSCHAKIVPEAARSAHRPVVEGKCTACHDPHASANKFVLLKPANDLCAGCHGKVAAAAAKAKFKHQPVVQGCTTCHDPHGSAKSARLLENDVPGLCVGCHKTDRQIFAKAHMDYPVAKADCTSCHDPHGSNVRGMLFDTVHPPVAKGGCVQCHEPPSSKTALATKSAAPQLCRGCHGQKLGAMMEKARVHRPVADGSCLACHGPHATREKGLLRGGMVGVCGSCHGDTIRRQELSPTKHDPVRDGQCTVCHDPHSSDRPLALREADQTVSCGACHDWLTHSSHPMGDKVPDPRNRNLRLQCLSCHRAHGTEYKHLMPFATTTDLCTKCHEKFKR